MGVASIYGLYDADGALRYIGKANDPAKRLASHMRDSRVRDTPVYRWIRKNGRPTMRILSTNCRDWKAEERRLIAEARGRGDRLLNVAEGGDQPACSTEQRRANAVATNAKRNATPRNRRMWEIKRQIGDAAKRGYLREDQRAKFRALANRYPGLWGGFAAR